MDKAEDLKTHYTREEWLNQAVDLLRPHLEAQGGRDLPPVSVTCGWPSSGGTARTKRVIGQCWDADVADIADGRTAIFISPTITDSGEYGVLPTLVHELVHAMVGCEAKHKGPFAKVAKAVGLLGKPTATYAGPSLMDHLAEIRAKLGEYPHGVITPRMKEKVQTTRMIKMECATCGYVARTTRKWLDVHGAVICPCEAGQPMDVEEPATPDSDEEADEEPDASGERLASDTERCWACKHVIAANAQACPACDAPQVED